jgi:hypothetical protein
MGDFFLYGDLKTEKIVINGSLNGTDSTADGLIIGRGNAGLGITALPKGATLTDMIAQVFVRVDGTANSASATDASASIHTEGGISIEKNLYGGARLQITGESQFDGTAVFNNTTQSTSSTSGAAIVKGGLGIAKNIYGGARLQITGESQFNGTAVFNNAAQSTSSTTGAVAVVGGLGVAKNIYGGARLQITGESQFDGTAVFNNTTQSTSINSGATVVKGGLGVVKDVWVGGDLHVAGAIVENSTQWSSETVNVTSPSASVTAASPKLKTVTFFNVSGTGNSSGTFNFTGTNAPAGTIKEFVMQAMSATRLDITVTGFRNPSGGTQTTLRFTQRGQSIQMVCNGTNWFSNSGGASIVAP